MVMKDSIWKLWKMEDGECPYLYEHGKIACRLGFCKHPARYLGTSGTAWEVKVDCPCQNNTEM